MHVTSFWQVHEYVEQMCPQTEGSLAGAADVLAAREQSWAAAEAAGDAEGDAAQLNGKQTGENLLGYSAAEPRLLFNLTHKCRLGQFANVLLDCTTFHFK